MTKLADVIQRGTNAARPAATTVPVGTLYYDTTNSSLGRSNGTTWDSVEGGGGSGTFTTVKDEGSNLSTAVVSMDFVGAGVTATGTTAVTVTIPGGGNYIQLADSLLGSDTASFDFTSISGSYKHLQIVLQTRGATSATNVFGTMTFNNDTGSNYDCFFVQFFTGYTNAAVNEDLGTTSMAHALYTCADTSPTAEAGSAIITIPNYAATTFNKTMHASGYLRLTTGSPNVRPWQSGGNWRSTAAITRVTIAPTTGNWKTGSRATLYGLS